MSRTGKWISEMRPTREEMRKTLNEVRKTLNEVRKTLNDRTTKEHVAE